jgi:tetratricopeptide (TPR) repeat protein
LEQLAAGYDRQGQRAQKEDCLRRLLTGFPNHPVTIRLYTAEARARLAAKDYAGAAAWFQKVEAGLAPADREQFKFAQTMASPQRVDPKVLLTMANEQLTKNEVGQAIQFYEEYLQRFPDVAGANEAKTKLGWCYALQKQMDKAERLWQSVIARGAAGDPWVGESQWNMIRLLAGPKNKWEDAAKLCETVAKNFPKQFRGQQAMFTRAWLYWAHGKWQPARAAFEDLVKAYPDVLQHPPIQEYIQQCDQHLAKGAKG